MGYFLSILNQISRKPNSVFYDYHIDSIAKLGLRIETKSLTITQLFQQYC